MLSLCYAGSNIVVLLRYVWARGLAGFESEESVSESQIAPRRAIVAVKFN